MSPVDFASLTPLSTSAVLRFGRSRSPRYFHRSNPKSSWIQIHHHITKDPPIFENAYLPIRAACRMYRRPQKLLTRPEYFLAILFIPFRLQQRLPDWTWLSSISWIIVVVDTLIPFSIPIYQLRLSFTSLLVTVIHGYIFAGDNRAFSFVE